MRAVLECLRLFLFYGTTSGRVAIVLVILFALGSSEPVPENATHHFDRFVTASSHQGAGVCQPLSHHCSAIADAAAVRDNTVVLARETWRRPSGDRIPDEFFIVLDTPPPRV